MNTEFYIACNSYEDDDIQYKIFQLVLKWTPEKDNE